MDSDDDFKKVVKPKNAKEKENKEPSFPEVTESVPAQFTESKRGRPLLIDPYNYVYQKNRDYNGKTYWRCVREQSKVFPR
jgi:hypothetical protein